MAETVVIAKRYNGPTASGQGGYVAGIVARYVGGVAEVTLRRPPPLEVPLRVARGTGGTVSLHDGEALVAEGRPAELDLEVPNPPTVEQAHAAERRFEFGDDHPLPTCFGCGNQRADNDGLRIFPGPVAGHDMVAATWRPDPSLAGADGGIGPEIIWAAIDCPGGFAVIPGLRAGYPAGSRVVLGRCVAEVADRVEPERPCVIIGWPLSTEGRKLYAGVALFSDQGTLLAATRQTWIVVLPQA